MDKEKDKKVDKRARTLFLILIPSLLLAIDYGSVLTNIAVKLIVFILQFVTVKSVLDEYYKYQ